MPVQREELHARLRLVSEDDDGTVVERGAVISEGVYGAAKRGVDRRAGIRKEVEPQMNRAPFGQRGVGSGEERRAVEEPWFIIASDPHADAGVPHRG